MQIYLQYHNNYETLNACKQAGFLKGKDLTPELISKNRSDISEI